MINFIIASDAEKKPELVKGGPFFNPWELDGAFKLRKLIKCFKMGKLLVEYIASPINVRQSMGGDFSFGLLL